MPTFGNNPTFNTWEFTGVNLENQIAEIATVPVDCDVTSISCFLGGDGAAVSAKLCIWNASGNVLYATPVVTVASRPRTTSGQYWVTKAITPLHLLSGQNVYIGWWRAAAGGAVWSYDTTGGSHLHQTALSAPAKFVGFTTHTPGRIGAFATYSVPVAPPTSGRVWTTATVKVSYPI